MIFYFFINQEILSQGVLQPLHQNSSLITLAYIFQLIHTALYMKSKHQQILL